MKQKRNDIADRIRDWIFDVPWIFIQSRSVLQGGFKTEKILIRSFVGSSSRVLDFGCGTGQYCELFASQNYTGVDIPGPHLRYARKRFPERTFLEFDSSFRVPWDSAAFDWILCLSVVHHVPVEGMDRFRGEILRLLKPGGNALLVDPAPVAQQGNLWSKSLLGIDRGRFPRAPEEVIQFFSEAMTVQKSEVRQIGSYRMYVLVLKRN